MPKNLETLDVRSRREWRNWLQEHHASAAGIWLVFHKRHTSETSIAYHDALDEALCFGWVDSLIKRLDDDRYTRKFTPRKADSKWSTINRKRYADLKDRGLLAAPGLERAPTSRSYPPRPSVSAVLPYIETQLKAYPRAWSHFESLAPSHRRAYIDWISAAKREETKQKRLQEAISLLAAGKQLGLK